MDRLIAINTVPFSGADEPPPSGTPEYATDGNPPTSPATVWPAYWFNTLQDELLNVIAAAAITPNRFSNTQVLQALKILIQTETGNYAIDTGTSGTHYVVAPPVPILTLPDGYFLRFFTAHASTTGAAVAISGLPEVPLVRDDGTAIQPGDIPANGIAAVQYEQASNQLYLLSVQALGAVDIQAQAGNGADDTGSVNHIVCTLTPNLTTHKKYAPIRVKIANTNTGATDFNPGPGTKSVVARDGSALIGGELPAGAIVEFMYTGSVYMYFIVAAPLKQNLTAALGHITFAGGFTLQWGQDTTPITSDGPISVVFDVGFTAACFIAGASIYNNNSSDAKNLWAQTVSMSTSGATFYAQGATGSGSKHADGLFWWAFGK